MTTTVVVATDADAGQRVDRVLAAHLPEMSRARVQALIKDGRVTSADGTVSDASLRVKPSDRFEIEIPPAASPLPAPEQIPLAIVYEDQDLVVIDKPAGLVVHPAAGRTSGTMVNALIAHCGDTLSGIGGVRRPGIVHRLDKDTSGLLVVAKNDEAHRALSAQFAAHGADGRLTRAYLALVWGEPRDTRGRIDAPLARSRVNRTKIEVHRGEASRHAATRYEVVERFHSTNGKPLASLLRLELETGRTHQIRVHLAHIGHPVMGDQTYGSGFAASANTLSEAAQGSLARLGRQALHAAHLGFDHPRTNRAMAFDSPLPPDMGTLLAALREVAVKPLKKKRK